MMKYALGYLIPQIGAKIKKINLSHRQEKTLVKEIPVDLSFVQSKKKLSWLESFLMEVDVGKKGNLEYMQESIFSKNGLSQVSRKKIAI